MAQDKAKAGSVTRAFQGLTDGLTTLFSQHLRLFGLELKRDGGIVGRYTAAMTFFAAIALIGYVLLNLAAILFAGVALGLGGMAMSALVLASINLGFAGRAMMLTVNGIKKSNLGPQIAGNELERSRLWAKQIQEEGS